MTRTPMTHIHRLDRVTSTQDLLHELAAAGAEPGTTVVAGEQTGGRGSRGRAWHSGRGGLWCSVLFRPGGGGAELAGIRVGLATAEILGSMGLGDRARLKWPNDLMLEDRKVGGILCESRWSGEQLSWIAAGIGINVTNSVPSSLAGSGTSLQQHLPGVELENLLAHLLARLTALDLSGPVLAPDELRRWGSRDWLLGRRLLAPAAGTATGLGQNGTLEIRADDGSLIRCRIGSVELAPSPALP
jgi:BirA family transcriptional regulator, biotin operon repressor / biotin---[acetyl-CoA-carboxylase] ligase